MARQITYKSTPQFNYGAAIDKEIEDVQGVIDERVSQRKYNQLRYEETQAKTDKAAKKSKTSDPSYNVITLEGAELSKKMMYENNQSLIQGKIGSSESNRFKTNTNDSWKNYIKFSKGYQEVLNTMEERLPNDASIIERYTSGQYALLANLKGAKIGFGKDGAGTFNGQPMLQLNNTEVDQHDRKNVAELMDANKELIGGFKALSSQTDISTEEGYYAFLNESPDAQKFLDGVYARELENGNDVASIIGDNSFNSKGDAWFVYKDSDLEDDVNGKKVFTKDSGHEGESVEDGFLLVKNDSGVGSTAAITTDQMKFAKEVLDVGLANAMGVKLNAQYQPGYKPMSPGERARLANGLANYKAVVKVMEGDASFFNNSGEGRTEAKWVGENLTYLQDGETRTLNLEGLSNRKKMKDIYTHYKTGGERDYASYDESERLYNGKGLKPGEFNAEGEFAPGSAYDLVNNDGKSIELIEPPEYTAAVYNTSTGKMDPEVISPTFSSVNDLETYISERALSKGKVKGNFEAYLYNQKVGKSVNYQGKYGLVALKDGKKIFEPSKTVGKGDPIADYVKKVLTSQVLRLPDYRLPLKGKKGVDYSINKEGVIVFKWEKDGKSHTIETNPKINKDWMQDLKNKFTKSYDPSNKKKLTVAQLKAANPNLSMKEIMKMFKDQ